jgi:ParB family chromosome partitioning protein
MLVLALAGRNVTVLSGVTGRHRASHLAVLAETLTEGGVLTRDLTTIRHAARETLVEVLSCRENHSASGMGARYAGTAIDADTFLPNMATEEFLPALSRAALEKCAVANDVAPQSRVKDTRAAVVARFAAGTFIYPDARFAPTAAELEALRDPASLIADDDDTDGLEDGEDAEGLESAEYDRGNADNEGSEIDGSLAAAALDDAAYAERTAHSA